MFYLIAFIACIVFATVGLTMFLIAVYDYGFIEAIRSKHASSVLIAAIALIITCIPLFNKYKQKVQSNAIDHYIVGDVELVEKRVDGEVVDWYYIVTPVDYE